MLKCICGAAYIGTTKPALKLCIAEHKAAIHNENTDYAIARHCNHGSSSSLRFEHAQISPSGGDIVRKLKESEAFWQ
jgi:hypothetical protein